ncbi:DEAD/DEAH box helicase family protein (plasmid) [Pseudomonas sp. FeN3W]|nr:DEAD/DEAH box helicase family protein [Pseudomonas sp. FeN3W]
MSRNNLNEQSFESSIVSYLSASSYIVQASSLDFNQKTGFIDSHVIEWIQSYYSNTYNLYVQAFHEKADEKLIRDVRSAIDKEGTLSALRKGFLLEFGDEIKLMGLPDVAGSNKKIQKQHENNHLTFIQQLYIDDHGRRIDIAFFLNGICIFTWELKHSSKQSVEDAMDQYRKPGRYPTVSPILKPLTGALAHFAISNEYVYVTTELCGTQTRFLPFNTGTEDGGGNPVNPSGYATSYLWERVFARDNLLELISDYLFVENGRLVFPRFHQWDCVEHMKQEARSFCDSRQTKKRLLAQHSPGSGKTKTISWLAHHLTRLNQKGRMVFDSVILVTDRKMLDNQLKEAMSGFDKAEHFTHAGKSKSLAKLIRNKENIITTLHKFHHAFKGVKRAVKSGRVAIIIDEAHSSQSGEMSNTMIEKISENIGENMVLYAFTATPTSKTLDIFGKPDHVYSMRQAIAEGFIVNVLKKVSFNSFVFTTTVDPGSEHIEVDAKNFKGEVFKSALRSEPMIKLKSEYILHHFLNSVYPVSPWAKAMIVANDIKSAIAYKIIIDRLINSKGLGYKTLISYTGKASLPELDVPDEIPSSVLCGLGYVKSDDQWIRSSFDTDEYQFLIVVNKYTTGFDQPKLMAMYIDQKMEGVRLVQTINRLNRSYPTKTAEMVHVVDLSGNTPEVYKESVEPYYGETEITGDSSISCNMIQIKSRLAAYSITDEIASAFDASHHKDPFMSELKSVLIKNHAQAIPLILHAISYYIGNYPFAINAGFPVDRSFFHLLLSLRGYLVEFYEINDGKKQNSALDAIDISDVKHVKSEQIDITPTQDEALMGTDGIPSPVAIESSVKTVAECLNEINAQMLQIMSANGIQPGQGGINIKDVMGCLTEGEREELLVNDMEDILKDSDAIRSLMQFGSKIGATDIGTLSASLAMLIKTNQSSIRAMY